MRMAGRLPEYLHAQIVRRLLSGFKRVVEHAPAHAAARRWLSLTNRNSSTDPI